MSRDLNVDSAWQWRRSTGKRFRIDGAATTYAQRPKVTDRLHGTIKSTRSDERFRRSAGFDDVRTHMSRWYSSANSWNALYASDARPDAGACRRGGLVSRVHTRRLHQIAWLLRFWLTVVDGCHMPEDHRVTSCSSPTGKLRMHAATNVEHRAIVNNDKT